MGPSPVNKRKIFVQLDESEDSGDESDYLSESAYFPKDEDVPATCCECGDEVREESQICGRCSRIRTIGDEEEDIPEIYPCVPLKLVIDDDEEYKEETGAYTEDEWDGSKDLVSSGGVTDTNKLIHMVTRLEEAYEILSDAHKKYKDVVEKEYPLIKQMLTVIAIQKSFDK